MSYTQKNLKFLLDEITERQSKQNIELSELKHIKDLFQETEKAKQAKEVAFSKRLNEARKKFSSFFTHKTEAKAEAV